MAASRASSVRFFRFLGASGLLHRPITRPVHIPLRTQVYQRPAQHQNFSGTLHAKATYNQVRRGCRQGQKARKRISPALINRPEMKGVCLKVSTVKPKKPNSAARKVSRATTSNSIR
ncbi:MAG: hypothetical protein M1815_000609 [Lichina confinis]|nr:MAG: hypothetical protein M1815_000609 [Lichina confinis]